MTTRTRRALGILAAGAVALGLSAGAQAALTGLVYDNDYTPVGASGAGLIWVADANLFKTQYDAAISGGFNIVTGTGGIIDTVGSITSSNGTHTLVAGDFNTSNGRMTWYGAMAWAEWLGSINYGGADDWRLPSALNQDGSGPCYGYNCSGSELGHLHYSEGGLTAGQSILADPPGILDDYFTHIQSYVYWSGTDYAPDPSFAWSFSTGTGGQGGSGKSLSYYAWAVRPGDVPLPGAGLLLASALVGLGWAHRPR